MWLMIMCVAGSLDLISPPEPAPQPEVAQEETIVEDVNDRENLGSSEESNSLENLNSSIELPPVPEDEKPSIEELLEKILEKLEKIEKNSGQQLDEMEEFEKMIRKVVREEIDNAFKEREQKKAVKTAPKPEPKPVEEPQPEQKPATGSEVTLFFYPMPGCEPCVRMKNELVTSNMGVPLMQGRYPCTFRDGTPVTTYPSAELMDGGKLVKRWVGYTPAYAIRDEYELYMLNQTR